MTVEIEEVKVQEEEEQLWTTDYLIYEIKHDLAVFVISGKDTDSLAGWCQCRSRKTKTQLPLVIWKYYHQAMHFFKIGAFASNMIPKFQISMEDLKPSILRELAELNREDRNFVLKQAVGHIFEDINSRLYHMSISKLLEVQLID